MYTSFVLACNYALGELSAVEIEGLPSFELEKQIVFAHNHQPVKSLNHRLPPRVKPDIVLLQWGLFASPTAKPFPYSRSYLSDLCTSESDLGLSWRDIWSTAVMEFEALPDRIELPTSYDRDFGALTEIPLYTPLADDPQPALRFIPEDLPMRICKFGSFPRFLPLTRLHR